MKTNKFDPDELELLAAGYVLDDLDEAETARVEQLIQLSPAMREQIRQSLAVMGIFTSDAPSILPPVSLKNKIREAFDAEKAIADSQPKNVTAKYREKTIVEGTPPFKGGVCFDFVNLENWFQKTFEAGWQMAAEISKTPKIAPAFRNTGVVGGKVISIGSNNTPIILIVRVAATSTFDRDVEVEIMPESEREYLPDELRLLLLDSDRNIVMEAISNRENKNIKFEFSGTSKEVFRIKLELLDRYFQEDFIL